MRKINTRPPLDYYLDLKYPVLVHEEKEGGYFAEVPDLPGCLTQAETLDELMAMVKDAQQAWIEAAYADGREIPLPRSEEEYSGKLVLRMPVSLHRRLVRAAADERISLNQYLVQLLSGKVDLALVLNRIEELEKHSGSSKDSKMRKRVS